MRQSGIFRHEAQDFRIENGISVGEKIEVLANTKDVYSQTIKLASMAWKNNGFIIKHQVPIAETPSPLQNNVNQADQITELPEIIEAATETTIAEELPNSIEKVNEILTTRSNFAYLKRTSSNEGPF